MADKEMLFSIGAVERDTGIGRDTLRVWERRYGFPVPTRNEKGERAYPEVQLRRLQRIRRLLDTGLRPGKLLPLGEVALDELEAGLKPVVLQPVNDAVHNILHTIRYGDGMQTDDLLRRDYKKQGMKKFIVSTVVPLLEKVGSLWINGDLQIYQEHLLSEHLKRFLYAEIAGMQKSAKKPRVLLATLPGEEHTLGLLIVAAMLSAHDVAVVNLGGEIPMDQIAAATAQYHADIVGITFSGAYQYKNIRPHLLELRRQLPDHIDIWTGGEGVRSLRKLPAGIARFTSLENLPL